MPRSVTYCLKRCEDLLEAALPEGSATAQKALQFLEELLRTIRRLDWYVFFLNNDDTNIRLLRRDELLAQLDDMIWETMGVHHVITDNFLSHQTIISDPEPTLF
jgi:uncharacterized alpha-E superfamily protein